MAQIQNVFKLQFKSQSRLGFAQRCGPQCTSEELYEPVECSIEARMTGSQWWNSLTHWCITVAGQIINTGPRPT